MYETNETPTPPGRRPGDPTARFSDRVENYVKYRPGYPPAVLSFLAEAAGLTPASIVADVGSGTGISSKLLLDHGNAVFGVEPNREMRAAAERLLSACANFRSIDGTAEATTLPAGSIDLVVAGQAFHWFDPAAAGAEFRRILRPGGRVALMWNCRLTNDTPFLEAYERLLLEYATDYADVRHENAEDEAVGPFFGPGGFREANFPNRQSFDFDGLHGRLLSSSYAPPPGHPRHEPMMKALRDLYDRFQSAGRVEFLYRTNVYVGSPAAADP